MFARSTSSRAPFCRFCLPRTEHHEAVGSIVNVASVSGLVGIKQRFAYCTSKGAIIAMTRQLAVEYPKTLRVNAVCPGTVQTPFVEGYLEKFHKHNKEEMRAELRARQPVGRLGRPTKWRPPFAILRRTKLPSSAARCLPSMAAGQPHNSGAMRRSKIYIGGD